MPGPDLTRAAATVEGLMDDRCRLARDADGVPGVLNDETGVVAGGEETLLHADLPCLLTVTTPGDGTPEPLDATVATEDGARYRGLLPLSVTDVRPGDALTVTSSRRDPTLVGRAFVIDAVGSGTYLVARIVGMSRR